MSAHVEASAACFQASAAPPRSLLQRNQPLPHPSIPSPPLSGIHAYAGTRAHGSLHCVNAYKYVRRSLSLSPSLCTFPSSPTLTHTNNLNTYAGATAPSLPRAASGRSRRRRDRRCGLSWCSAVLLLPFCLKQTGQLLFLYAHTHTHTLPHLHPPPPEHYAPALSGSASLPHGMA